MNHLLTSALLISALVFPTSRADEVPRFEWKDGDRVVLIGDTLIERDQSYGYLETVITAQNPDKSITFRNLGWSGDTVRGLSRSGFGPQSEGWTQLKDHVLALKPTVLIVGYGMADSFDGDAGLASFVSGYNALLDAFAALKPRLILLSPIAHEDLGRPLPDPTRHNASLKKYRDAIEAIAAEREARFIDLSVLSPSVDDRPKGPLTDDGIHLSEFGSWVLARHVAWRLDPSATGNTAEARVDRQGGVKGSRVAFDDLKIGEDGARLRAALMTLPLVDPPTSDGGFVPFRGRGDRLLLVASSLKPGNYRLSIDGMPRDQIGDSEDWSDGFVLVTSPDLDQAQMLRQAINAKNRLYFYRWRPQNETYLFGFRKHEQGNNAREVPLFDPLVEAKEKEIARLRKPVMHTYEIVRQP